MMACAASSSRDAAVLDLGARARGADESCPCCGDGSDGGGGGGDDDVGAAVPAAARFCAGTDGGDLQALPVLPPSSESLLLPYAANACMRNGPT